MNRNGDFCLTGIPVLATTVVFANDEICPRITEATMRLKVKVQHESEREREETEHKRCSALKAFRQRFALNQKHQSENKHTSSYVCILWNPKSCKPEVSFARFLLLENSSGGFWWNGASPSCIINIPSSVRPLNNASVKSALLYKTSANGTSS